MSTLERYRRAWLLGGNGRRPGRAGYWVEWLVPSTTGGWRRLRSAFPSLTLAKRFAARKTEQLNASLFGDLAWTDMIDRFTEANQLLEENTQLQYLATLHAFVKHVGFQPSASELTPQLLQRFMNLIQPECSNETLHKHRRHVRRFIRFGMSQEPPWWGRDISAPLRLPKRVRKLIRAPSVADVASLLTACLKVDDPLGWYAAVRLGFETGLRQRDLAELRWDHVTYEDNCIPESLRRSPRAQVLVIVRPARKTAKELLWVVTPELERVIELLRAEGRRGGVLGWTAFNSWAWRTLRKGAGLTKVRFHSLRETAATTTQLVHSGAAAAQRLLDHSALATTRGHYLDQLAWATRHSELLEALPLPRYANPSTAAPTASSSSGPAAAGKASRAGAKGGRTSG